MPNQFDTAFYTPLTTLKRTLGQTSTNNFFIGTSSPAHDDIDATTTRIEDRLAAAGYASGRSCSTQHGPGASAGTVRSAG